MTVLTFSALVVGLRDGWTPLEQAVFALSAFTASASWQMLLAGAGAALGAALTGPRGRLATSVVSSAVIGVLAVGVLRT